MEVSDENHMQENPHKLSATLIWSDGVAFFLVLLLVLLFSIKFLIAS